MTLTAAPVSAGPHMSSCSPHYPECPQTLPNVTEGGGGRGGRGRGEEEGEGGGGGGRGGEGSEQGSY